MVIAAKLLAGTKVSLPLFQGGSNFQFRTEDHKVASLCFLRSYILIFCIEDRPPILSFFLSRFSRALSRGFDAEKCGPTNIKTIAAKKMFQIGVCDSVKVYNTRESKPRREMAVKVNGSIVEASI